MVSDKYASIRNYLDVIILFLFMFSSNLTFKNHIGFQDAIDLFLGNYVVEQSRLAPRSDRSWKYLLVGKTNS